MKLVFVATLLFLMAFAHQDGPLLVETDRVKGVIVTDTKQWEFMFEGKEFWTPTKGQALEAEEVVEKFLKEKRPAQSPELWQKLTRYKRQYVGYVADGRKRIHVNFYCSEEPLTSKPVLYDDGGDCFFQVDYDVEGRKVEKLSINGEA